MRGVGRTATDMSEYIWDEITTFRNAGVVMDEDEDYVERQAGKPWAFAM